SFIHTLTHKHMCSVKRYGWTPGQLRISQETLAEMIGTTRSRVSHFMNKFRRAGLIEYGGEIVVYPALLQAVLNDNLQAEQQN
ncbi:helix-turn-helix domain-containing protein, partial [Bradyrhizobium sp. SZCCHNS3053]|uniref:helix-turn-helix domain-containing protein n=1 Tax=Bradyrhizobium sp. SZCCHNS3053 TaxID=3057322 RepID=UPI002916F944